MVQKQYHKEGLGSLVIKYTGEARKESINRVYKVESIELENENNSYNLTEDVPSNWSVYCCYKRFKTRPSCKEIHIEGMSNPAEIPNFIAGLLHEIRHSNQYNKPNNGIEEAMLNVENPNKETRFEHVKQAIASEYDAWEYALEKIKNMNFTGIDLLLAHNYINHSVQSRISNIVVGHSENLIKALDFVAENIDRKESELKQEIISEHEQWLMNNLGLKYVSAFKKKAEFWFSDIV